MPNVVLSHVFMAMSTDWNSTVDAYLADSSAQNHAVRTTQIWNRIAVMTISMSSIDNLRSIDSGFGANHSQNTQKPAHNIRLSKTTWSSC